MRKLGKKVQEIAFITNTNKVLKTPNGKRKKALFVVSQNYEHM